MIRGAEGQSIFREDKDRRDFFSRIAEISEDTGARIVAWVLMSNHVHILMFSRLQRISKFMRRMLTGYAVWCNRKYQRSLNPD